VKRGCGAYQAWQNKGGMLWTTQKGAKGSLKNSLISNVFTNSTPLTSMQYGACLLPSMNIDTTLLVMYSVFISKYHINMSSILMSGDFD
jgi:hypothetical protein